MMYFVFLKLGYRKSSTLFDNRIIPLIHSRDRRMGVLWTVKKSFQPLYVIRLGIVEAVTSVV